MMHPRRRIVRPLPSLRRQRGLSLLIAVIMLVLLTLLGISAFNSSNVNLQVVGNMQQRQEAQAAANQAIAEVLSSAAFTNDPAFGTTPITVDVNQDATPDYAVTVTRACNSATTIANTQLDPKKRPDDEWCYAGGSFDSLCSDSNWDIQARAVDAPGVAKTGADTTVHQGVAVRISSAEQGTFCR